MQQQPGAQTQQQRAHDGLQKFRQRLVATGPVRRQRLQVQKLALPGHPAAVNVAQHAHGLNHLRIAQRAVGVLLGGNGVAVRGHQRRLGVALVEPADEHLQQRADNRRPAQHRADSKHQRQKHQRDRRFHQRQQRRRAEKIAQRAQVVERLQAAAGDFFQIRLEDGAENPLAQLGVELGAGLVHDLRACPFQHLHQHISAQHRQRQHGQCQVVAAVDDAVIDFEHVAAGREHQQAGKQAEPGGARKVGPQ